MAEEIKSASRAKEQRLIREAERSLIRIRHIGWIIAALIIATLISLEL